MSSCPTSRAASRSTSRLGRSSCVAACRSSTSQAGSPSCAAMLEMDRAYAPSWSGSTSPLTSRMSAAAYACLVSRWEDGPSREVSCTITVRRDRVESKACGSVVMARHADSCVFNERGSKDEYDPAYSVYGQDFCIKVAVVGVYPRAYLVELGKGSPRYPTRQPHRWTPVQRLVGSGAKQQQTPLLMIVI